jgi:rhomboid family GlyGly-CTERM serine protease
MLLRDADHARWCWPALAALLAALSLWMRGTPTSPWDWQPALAWSEPWRWWSAAVLHWSDRHLAMNLGGCVVLAWFGWRAQAGAAAAAAWLACWPLAQLGLLLQPALSHYAGLSGVLHGGATVLAWLLCGRRLRRQRLIGAALGLGLMLKLLSEQAWHGPTRLVPGWDFLLAPMAHITGAAAGLICAALFLGRRTEPPAMPPPSSA